MHVRLVADVPDELVGGQIEDFMQREGQLDDAEIRREVSAVDRARADEQIANLTCQDIDLAAFKAFDVGW